MDLEVFFMALDGPEDVGKLLSLEVTGAYINEGREIVWEVMEGLSGRVDRYPETIKNEAGEVIYGATEPGIIIDSNPPRTTHWLYEKFQPGNTPKGWKKYTQPPAVYWDDTPFVDDHGETHDGQWVLNPDAENLAHLSPGYYQNQLANGEEYIKVMLAGEYGMTRLGKPVFTKFSTIKHVAKEPLKAHRGSSLIVGIDFGLNVGCVVGQLNYSGLEILDELPAADESLEDFLDQYLVPLLRKKYAGYKVIACGDPSGGGRSSLNKMTAIQLTQSRGITTVPAVTNAFVRRKEAVDWFLGRDNGFVVDPRCTQLIEALSAGYVWKESRNKKGQILDIADKNEHSHIADAVQYMCLYAKFGGGSLTNNKTIGGKKSAKKYLWA